MPNASHAAAILIGLLALATVPAEAAPQALGVVASDGIATPLLCDGSGECSARISAFCLQETRDAPSQGTAYRLADTGAMTLRITRHDGSSFRLAANGYVRIESQLGFTAVKVSLPQNVVAALDAAAIAVEVAPNASLLPVETAGDPDPQTAEEIALATGPMRAAAASIFEAPGPTADAARLTTLMINALPQTHDEDLALADRLWDETVTPQVRAALSPAGIAAAEQLYDGCKLAVESHTRLSMRECLALRHADLMVTSNRLFWQETGGS
jgi:hypothetical protein